VNPLTNPPGRCNLWNTNGRQQIGGLGGRPYPASSSNLKFGGGGGAGHGDSFGSGGRGGGVVFLVADTINALGAFNAPSVNARGENGRSSADSGPGGGGAGGSVYVWVSAPNFFLSDITVSVAGGDGGSTSAGTPNELVGGGGSGGGGAVFTNADIIADVQPGNAGSNLKTDMASFPPNGATRGCLGLQLPICAPPPPPISVTPSNTASNPAVIISASLSFSSAPSISSISSSPSTKRSGWVSYFHSFVHLIFLISFYQHPHRPASHRILENLSQSHQTWLVSSV